MWIIGLVVENFLRIEAVEIRPDGNMVVVSGRNEQGKSALINSMWVALGGDAPEQPIRAGAEKARIVVEVGDAETAPLVVERVWTASGMRLRVTQERDGARVTFNKPQAMLTGLLSSVALDPEAFSRMPAGDQAELLKTLTGLDTSDLDAEHDRLYAERRDVNRDIKRMGECPPPDGERPEAVNVQALMSEMHKARREASVKRDAVAQLDSIRQRERDKREEIDVIEREITTLKQRMAYLEKDVVSDRKEGDERVEAIKAMPDWDAKCRTIGEQVSAAETSNAAVRLYESEKKRAAEAENMRAVSAVLTEKLKDTEAARAERIAAVEMPIDGLSIEDGVVRFEGLPLSQASAARKLEIGFAIGRAQNPRLRVVRIEHGSNLDSRMLEVVERECEKHGYQAWIERVADADTGVGLYIEDGRVVSREEGAE